MGRLSQKQCLRDCLGPDLLSGAGSRRSFGCWERFAATEVQSKPHRPPQAIAPELFKHVLPHLLGRGLKNPKQHVLLEVEMKRFGRTCLMDSL